MHTYVYTFSTCSNYVLMCYVLLTSSCICCIAPSSTCSLLYLLCTVISAKQVEPPEGEDVLEIEVESGSTFASSGLIPAITLPTALLRDRASARGSKCLPEVKHLQRNDIALYMLVRTCAVASSATHFCHILPLLSFICSCSHCGHGQSAELPASPVL